MLRLRTLLSMTLLTGGLFFTACTGDDPDPRTDQYPFLTLRANATGGQAVPASTTNFTGDLNGTLNTQTGLFIYRSNFSGAGSGFAPTAGFIQGGTATTARPGRLLTFNSLALPLSGRITLNQAQIDSLRNGQYYVVFADQTAPTGLIRGQIRVIP